MPYLDLYAHSTTSSPCTSHSAVNTKPQSNSFRSRTVHRRSRNSAGRRGSVGKPASGLGGAGAEGTTRRHDKMRRSLIGQALGKRGSIGTKSLAKTLAPTTPRPEARPRRQQQGSQFDFAEEDMEEGDDEDDEDGEEDFDYAD